MVLALVVEHTSEGCQTDVPTAIGDAGIDGAEFDASALGQFPDRSVDPAVEHLVVILGSRFREVGRDCPSSVECVQGKRS